MNVKGKWYLRANEAAACSRFWTGHAWSANPRRAAFFDTREQALVEARNAESISSFEVIVAQATRDLPDHAAR